MTPPKELAVVRTIENANGTRRLTMSVVEMGIHRWRVVRLSSLRWDDGEWRRVGYVDLDPRLFDELMVGLDESYDALLTRGAA